MIIRLHAPLILLLLVSFACAASEASSNINQDRRALRVMTMNAQDIATSDLQNPDNPRLKRLAAIIQRVRPNVLLLSEIARDSDAQNANRFVRSYLSVPQQPGLRPILYNTYMPPSNTGIHSGFDLNNDAVVTTEHPEPRTSDEQGNPAPQTQEGRDYANDCYGFGTYPGQYSMALLVDRRLTINHSDIRTFQNFLWKDLPDAQPPRYLGGDNFYSQQEWNAFRLSSKTLADVPVSFDDGTTVHFIISHPTPPAFDGSEQRNKLRNHDEIRLLQSYITDEPALIDDDGVPGGLADGAHFVILGDLNADPFDGDSVGSPITTFLIHSPKLAPDHMPKSDIEIDGLDPTDTARFKLRVDYVLPSAGIEVLRSSIWRYGHDDPQGFPSDHFPVWAELAIPAANNPDDS
jgi:endonuclease/exonuclease/phosphatase family metal-dependent hydrolase